MASSSSLPLCVACSARDSEVFWCDQDRTIRRCRACRLLFVFPQPDRAVLHNQFQSKYFTNGNSKTPTRLELDFEAWRRPTLDRITGRIRALKRGGKLLDVGCASGTIFEYFRTEHWELYGIEPSAAAFARLQERFGLDPKLHLSNAYLCDVNLEPKSLDVVTVLESLYYMPNPRSELSYLARVLRNDGVLAIGLPSYAFHRLRHSGPISSLLYGSRCSLTSSHLFYFSERSLSQLLASEGFRIFDKVQLGSSSYGSELGRFARQAYLKFSEALGKLTLGRLNLAPHFSIFVRNRMNFTRDSRRDNRIL